MEPFLVAGTWAWSDGRTDWYALASPFGQFLQAHGLTPTTNNGEPFIWSTALGGTPWTGMDGWAAGGAALAYFVMATQQRPGERTAIVAHSHGLQVVAYAAAEHGLKIQTLITVGSPIRKDMATRYAALRRNTAYWLHIHSDLTDHWQWFGEAFDGWHWPPIIRQAALANRNDCIKGVGHSNLLRDPAQFHYWIERGWLDLLKG